MSAHDDGIDKNLLEFARQVAAIPRQISEGARTVEVARQPPVESHTEPAKPVAPIPKTPSSDQARLTDETRKTNQVRQAPDKQVSDKKLRTSEELASLVLSTLREVGDCPPKGFVVTVYGSNPWNALLTIRPEAGTRIDRTLWVSRVQDIAARLRNEFDVADDTSSS